MKRSEVENRLYSLLDAMLDSVDPSIVRDLPSMMLCGLERLGMAPPEYLPEPQYCEVTGKQLECKPIRKWEKE